MALACDNCGEQWGNQDDRAAWPLGAGWWQSGHQLMQQNGGLTAYLAQRRDFCSEACLRAYYARPVPSVDAPPEATTQRLPAIPALLRRAVNTR